MRNCIKCNQELAKTTKGELCGICYRNRNKQLSHNHRILIDANSDDSTHTHQCLFECDFLAVNNNNESEKINCM